MEEILELNKTKLSKVAKVVEYLLLALCIFLVPLVVPALLEGTALANNSQYVVGSLVNSALILAAMNLSGWKKIVSIITVPSISAVMSGVILKTAAIYSVYMIPFIWVGNFALVYAYKKMYLSEKKNYILATAVACIVKVAAIFTGYKLLVLTSVINLPKVIEVFKISMGVNQLITVVIGSVIAFGISKVIYQNNKKAI